jgi:hypothetical protein
MREDFHKVIIERPRWGSSLPSPKTGITISHYDRDREYSFEGRRSRSWNWKWARKEFSDHLAPLRRYLDKQVGRPWRKIEGEIRKAVDTGTVVGRHLLDHLRGEVSISCFVGADGRFYRTGRDYPVQGLFVHPRTGLLLRAKAHSWNESKARRKRIEQANEVILDAETEAKRIDDVWYLFSRVPRLREIVHRRRDRTGKLVVHYETVRDDSKKQAGRKDLARIREALDASIR